jgi:hypothetical protein
MCLDYLSATLKNARKRLQKLPMAKERKSAYRAQFDGHRRLAAAVILQAIKDVSSGPSHQDKETAAEFLQGDMWPFSDVLDLPADGAALQDYLKNADLSSLEADPATN